MQNASTLKFNLFDEINGDQGASMFLTRRLGEQRIRQWISGKKVLFIFPSDDDYIRIRQEIELLKAHAAHVQQITFDDWGRLTFLNIKKILSTLIRTFESLYRPFDTVFIGGMFQDQ